MSQPKTKASGSCLCGSVTYKASLRPGVGACHCSMCRKWSSGPYMAVHADGPVVFAGSEHIGTFSSSAWAERGFCKNCGSALYYHLLSRVEGSDGEYILSAGTLTDQSTLNFDHEVFVDNAPDWYRLADDDERKRLTEADIMGNADKAD